MFSKQFITISHSKDLFFHVCSHAFNSFIFTLLFERSLILNGSVAEITELWESKLGSWEAELLDSLILKNVVLGISVVVRRTIFNERGG